MKYKTAEIVLSVAVLALGIAVALGTSRLSSAGGYSRIGPNAAPAVIAGGLILLGLWLLYEALSGGWRGASREEATLRNEHAFHTGAFLWVTAGLLAQMFLIDRAGFVLAQTALFACVARGFGSKRMARDLSIGLILGLAVFIFFVKFLNVSLPAGWLRPLLGSAGI